MNNFKTKLSSFILIIVVLIFGYLENSKFRKDAEAAIIASTNWEGWIRLGGIWTNSAHVQRNEVLSGYSWGAAPFGWMSYSGSNYQVYIDGNLFIDPPTVDLFSRGENIVRENSMITLEWTGEEVLSGSSCTTSDNSATSFAGRSVFSRGSLDVQVNRNTTFSISCRGIDGSIASDSLSITVCGGSSGRICPSSVPRACNLNGVCEVSEGETRQNCPQDCRSGGGMYREF